MVLPAQGPPVRTILFGFCSILLLSKLLTPALLGILPPVLDNILRFQIGAAELTKQFCGSRTRVGRTGYWKYAK